MIHVLHLSLSVGAWFNQKISTPSRLSPALIVKNDTSLTIHPGSIIFERISYFRYQYESAVYSSQNRPSQKMTLIQTRSDKLNSRAASQLTFENEGHIEYQVKTFNLLASKPPATQVQTTTFCFPHVQRYILWALYGSSAFTENQFNMRTFGTIHDFITDFTTSKFVKAICNVTGLRFDPDCYSNW